MSILSIHAWACYRLCLALIITGYCAAAIAGAKDEIILDSRDTPIRAGIYSPLARFQQHLWLRLRSCSTRKFANIPNSEARGTLGPHTAAAISALSRCKGFESLPASSPARAGALTQSLWQIVMGSEPPPELQDLVDTVVLSFEATDFSDKPEWNFCQDSSKSDLRRAQLGIRPFRCFNISAPCDQLTWGPRGATAGQGHEIQQILWSILRTDPMLLEQAFGTELPNILRFLHLKAPPSDDCTGDSPMEYFMCAVWMDPARRSSWESGLVALGASAVAREIYRRVYASEQLDGYKLRAYYQLWEGLELRPSEIDYAFFYDRATHIGGPPEDLATSDLKACVEREGAAQNLHAAARRCLSKKHRHPTMPLDRQARDVAYYINAYPRAQLSRAEVKAWTEHIPLDVAKNFGLSDERTVPIEKIMRPDTRPEEPAPQDSTSLTDVEKACPVEIRKPIRRAEGPNK